MSLQLCPIRHHLSISYHIPSFRLLSLSQTKPFILQIRARDRTLYFKNPNKLPARDRIIDFGKYKGKMLGSLPSKYLKWVSKNLRARDFEEWATLADEVLQDPVYKDRLEWEFADNILNGEDPRATRCQNPVSELLEISQRFGWDNDDKEAWSLIDFSLLGTSKGGRIPRIRNSGSSNLDLVQEKRERVLSSRNRFLDAGKMRKLVFPTTNNDNRESSGVNSLNKVLGTTDSGAGRMSSLQNDGKPGILFENKSKDFWREDVVEKKKVGFLSNGIRFLDEEEEDFEEETIRGKREERRERQKLKRRQQMTDLQKEVGIEQDRENRVQMEGRNPTVNLNPFPGRDALLRKIRSS